jgi:hypothetical protein
MPKGLLKTTSNTISIIEVSACHDRKCMHPIASTLLKLSAPSISVTCAAVPDLCLEVGYHSLIDSSLFRVHADYRYLLFLCIFAQVRLSLCIGTSQVSASSVQGKIAAPAAVSGQRVATLTPSASIRTLPPTPFRCMRALQVLSPSAPSSASCWLTRQPALRWESLPMLLLLQVRLLSKPLHIVIA